MSQPTEKRADELKIGEYIHDGRGIGPVEITHVQPHTNHHGDSRVLVVTADAAVSYHDPDQAFTMATAAELAAIRQTAEAARRAAKRREDVARLRRFADWLEQHPELPTPYLWRMQAGLNGDWDVRVAIVKQLAASLGVTPKIREDSEQEIAEVEYRVPDSFTYLLYTARTKPAPALDPETPLDELPADFGADHDPDECECDDCVAEAIDAAEAAAEADAADEPATVPVYADSVNGEELW